MDFIGLIRIYWTEYASPTQLKVDHLKQLEVAQAVAAFERKDLLKLICIGKLKTF